MYLPGSSIAWVWGAGVVGMENALHKYHEMMNARSNFPFHFSCSTSRSALPRLYWWNAAIITMTSWSFICIASQASSHHTSHFLSPTTQLQSSLNAKSVQILQSSSVLTQTLQCLWLKVQQSVPLVFLLSLPAIQLNGIKLVNLLIAFYNMLLNSNSISFCRVFKF